MASPRRRILIVSRGYWPMIGGGERLVTEVAEGLARRGHAVRVLLLDGGLGAPRMTPPPAGFGPPAGRHGVQVVRPPGWDRWERRLAVLRSRWIPGRGELRKVLRWVHGRTLRRLVLDAARRHDVVLLANTDTPALETFPPLVAARAFPLLISTQAHLEHPNWPHAGVAALWPRAAALAVNTAHEAEQVVARYGVDPTACVVTGCGTDLPAAAGPWPRPPRVLYLGRVGVEKQIDLLLDAMRLLWQRIPAARLVLAGARGPSTAVVDGWVAALPAAQRAQVEAPRDVSEEQKAALLAGARCLVSPSRHESFGIVLVEAWAHATPVVALDTAVSRAVVRPEETGLLAAPDDPAALAAALARLLEDPAAAERMGLAGRAEVERRHTWAHVAERYEAAVERALERFARVSAIATG